MENDNPLQIYEDIAVRTKAGLAAFNEVYSARVPRPTFSAVQRDYVSLFIIVGMIISTIAGVVVSGSRTIPEFGGGFIGSMAFLMLEGGIVSYAFFRARRNSSSSRIENTRQRAAWGLALGFVVAIGANIDYEFRSHGIYVPDIVSTAINLLVALSAPTLAFISSDVIAIELMAGDSRKRQAEKEFRETDLAWLDGRDKAWAREQARWGLKVNLQNDFVVEKPEIPALNQSNLIKDNDKSRFKPSPKLQKALDYLRQNEGDLFTPPRELESKFTGISYGTIHKAQQIIRSEKRENDV